MAHKSNVNAIDAKGKTLLHRALERKDEFSAIYLIENNASVDVTTTQNQETPLHLLCSQSHYDGIELIAKALLKAGADPNLQDGEGNTSLHRAILATNQQVFTILLEQPNISLEIRNNHGLTPLALALQFLDENEIFASMLVSKKSSVDASNPMTGDTLLHLAAKNKNEKAGIFLVKSGARVNSTNNRGETPLHIAAENGLYQLVTTLLHQGNLSIFKSQPG